MLALQITCSLHTYSSMSQAIYLLLDQGRVQRSGMGAGLIRRGRKSKTLARFPARCYTPTCHGGMTRQARVGRIAQWKSDRQLPGNEVKDLRETRIPDLTVCCLIRLFLLLFSV